MADCECNAVDKKSFWGAILSQSWPVPHKIFMSLKIVFATSLLKYCMLWLEICLKCDLAWFESG